MKRASMDPDGWLSRILLCFAATAGIMYVNIMPALVDALQAGLSFSQQQSGRIGSLNTYGGAFGALLMAFMAARLPWRRTLLVLSLLLVVMDYSCLHVTHAGTMMLLRFIHGLFGGSMVGMAFFIVARNLNPSRTFGILMVLQYGLYMVTIEIMPALVRSSGIGALFHFLMVFSGITFLFILAMPEYPLRSVPVAGADRAVVRNLPTMRLLAMISVLLFQTGNMSVNAYIVGLGQHAGLDLGYISDSLSISGLAGLLGGVFAMFMPTRWGLEKPIVVSMLLATVSVLGVLFAGNHLLWLVSNMVNGMAWALVLSLLFGMCACFDLTGKSAVWSGFMSKLGLASGPLLGSFVLGSQWHYAGLIVMGAALVFLGLLASLVPSRSADRVASLVDPTA